MRTRDVSWLFFLIVYGVDGCLTIVHRILLHENLGEAHRKHAYQIMANELRMSHPVVSLIYVGTQLVVSLGFVYGCPLVSSVLGIGLVDCHWLYLMVALVLLAVVYVLFMKKYYHLHEEYLAGQKAKWVSEVSSFWSPLLVLKQKQSLTLKNRLGEPGRKTENKPCPLRR